MDLIEKTIRENASLVSQRLNLQKKRIVFAESCTSGLLASTMGQISGISEVFCGSAVTYRNDTKTSWLNVSKLLLEDPEVTAVSEPVAFEMLHGVLQNTPEADYGLAVTGHLGPNAPRKMDGLVFIAIGEKGASGEITQKEVHRLILPVSYPGQETVPLLRLTRQRDLAGRIFELLSHFLERSM